MADATSGMLDAAALQQQVIALQQQVSQLLFILQQHIGPQPGAAQVLTPHPTYSTRLKALEQTGRYL